MKRYYPPHIEAKRQESLSRFYGFDEDWAHSVYAIVVRENGQKAPIYVGETARPRKRFLSHLKVAFGGSEASPELTRQLRRHIAKKSLIEMHGLAGATNRVEALSKEAGWARALGRRGFKLANSWSEHKASSRVERVSENRLIALSLAEAHALDTRLALECPRCHVIVPLAAEELSALDIGNPKLNRFNGFVCCSECGDTMRLRLELPSAVQLQSTIKEPSEEQVELFLQGIGRA